MNIEYEAVFTDIDIEAMRAMLKTAGATLVRPEFTQTREVFTLPQGQDSNTGWARIRDEGDKITMSVKSVIGEGIESQKEACVTVHDFTEAEALLLALGCKKKAYQETKRELWELDGVEVTIDTWPFLEPFVEVEGASEVAVKAVAEKLGFEWDKAKFCAVGTLYNEKYGVSLEQINNHTPKIVFDMENPFITQDKN